MVMKMKSKDKSKLGKIIGYGTSATIHEWNTGQIIKLFWPGTPVVRLIHNQDEQEIKILNMAIDEILDSLKEN